MSDKPRRRSKVLWVLLLLVLVVICAPVALGVGAYLLLQTDEAAAEGTVLELRLGADLAQGPERDPFALLTGESTGSFWALRRGLRRAARDASIAAVLLEVSNVAMDQATLSEVVAELERVEAAGKPVHVLLGGDLVGDGEFALASAGTHVWVLPETMWLVNGFSATVTFWRGTLEKLHVEPEVLMFREYKSAGEPYSRREMSPYFREALEDVVGDLQDLYVEGVVTRRGLDRAAFETLMSRGIFTGPEALEAGLVDELGYLDQVREALREVAGTDEYEGLGLSRYLEGGGGTLELPEDAPQIALVFGEGPIVASSGSSGLFGDSELFAGPEVAEAIRDAAEDDDVQAIVFRVDSPGGSAVGSDLVWREIQRAREAGKPVVVSMAGVAGSGGYWVAMGADAIVAHPNTITGSIGVVFSKMNVRGFYEWIGANVETIDFAENAGVMSGVSSLTEPQRAALVATLEHLYGRFKAKVAEGRSLELERVEELARGRIWSGRDALENGLVDGLGGLDVALGLARERAGIEGEAQVVLFPEEKDPIEQLIEDLLDVGVPGGLDPATVEAWVEDQRRPRLEARMPAIEVR